MKTGKDYNEQLKKDSRTQINYEWSIETMDEDGDIIDSSFWDKLPTQSLEENQSLVLVRNEGNEIEGLTDRYWAYVKDGKLPECFEDGAGHHISIRVPKKFHNELKRSLNT